MAVGGDRLAATAAHDPGGGHQIRDATRIGIGPE